MLFLVSAIQAQDEDMGLSRTYETAGFARIKVDNSDTTGKAGFQASIGAQKLFTETVTAATGINSTNPMILNRSLHLGTYAQGDTGRVGINTNAPTNTLDVNGSFRVVGVSHFNDDITYTSTPREPGNINLTNIGTIYRDSNNVAQIDRCLPWTCNDDGNVVLTDSSGNVGIGTSLPSHQFHISGINNTGTDQLLGITTNTGEPVVSVTYDNDGDFCVITLGDADLNNDGTHIRVDGDNGIIYGVAGNGFALGDDEGLNHGKALYQDNTGQLTYNGKFQITDGTEATGYVFRSGATGIGSWSPDNKHSFIETDVDSFVIPDYIRFVTVDAHTDTLVVIMPDPATNEGGMLTVKFKDDWGGAIEAITSSGSYVLQDPDDFSMQRSWTLNYTVSALRSVTWFSNGTEWECLTPSN